MQDNIQLFILNIKQQSINERSKQQNICIFYGLANFIYCLLNKQ